MIEMVPKVIFLFLFFWKTIGIFTLFICLEANKINCQEDDSNLINSSMLNYGVDFGKNEVEVIKHETNIIFFTFSKMSTFKY